MSGPPEWAQGDSGAVIPGVAVVDPAALRAWLETNEHAYNCAARDEGLSCCLDWLIDDEEFA